jgi:hypothetical protein
MFLISDSTFTRGPNRKISRSFVAAEQMYKSHLKVKIRRDKKLETSEIRTSKVRHQSAMQADAFVEGPAVQTGMVQVISRTISGIARLEAL